MDNTQIPITLEEAIFLKRRFDDIFDENLKPKNKTVFSKEVKQFYDIINSERVGIPKGTAPKQIGIKLEEWFETLSQSPEYSEPTLTKTTLDKDESEQLIAEAEARNKQKSDIKDSSDKAVQDALKRKRELIDKKIQEAINNKKVVVIPVGDLKDIELTNGEKETILTFSKVAKEDPATLEQFIETKIKESLSSTSDEYKQNITTEIITKSATSITENFIALPTFKSITEIPSKIPVMHPASPFVALTLLNDVKLKGVLTDEEVRNKVAEMAQVLAVGIEAEANVNFAGANAVFGENIASVFYGPADRSITQFEVAEDQDGQKDNGVELSIGDVYDNGKKFYDFYEKIKGARTVQEVTSTSMVYVPTYSQATYTGAATKTASVLTKALPAVGAVYGFKQGVLLSQWAKVNTPLLTGEVGANLLTAGGIKSTVMMSNGLSSKILFSKNFATGYSVQIMQFAKGSNTLYTAGATFGNRAFGVALGKSAGKISGAGTIAVKATGEVVAKVLPTAIASKIGAFLGSVGGWVGTAVGYLAGELFGKLLEKVNWAKVKKFVGEYVLPVAVGGGLVMFGAPVAGLVAGGLLFGVARGATLASITAGAFGILGFIGSSIGIAIATPVIITILVIPPLVAFIMLVINNSAYVVPPSLTEFGIGRISLPYIDITKTASPAGPLTNANLPKEITYTVTIKAKKSSLTNVKITDTCQVISRDDIPCPTFTIPSAPTSISPTTPYTFTYTAVLDAKYKDSVVINTIIVTADTVEQSGATAEMSNSLTIGNPPISCPVPGAKPLNSMNYSYNAGSNTGHGSTAYWDAMGSRYSYALPQSTGCMKPGDCPYYGYAYDVFPNGTTEVFAPSVLGKDVNWNCSYAFSNGGGSAGHTFHCTSTGSNYLLVLTHMNKNAKTGLVKSGEKIGTLYNQGTNTHLHLEFQLSGKWEKPENYFCK